MADEEARDTPPTPKSRETNLREFLPEDWRERGGHGFVSAYRMLGVPIADISPAFGVALADVCVVMGWFQLPHLRVEHQFEPTLDGTIKISVRGGEGEKRPGVPAALFFAPATQGQLIEHTHAQERIHETIALLSAFWTMTLAFEHIEDYWFSFADGLLLPAAVFIGDSLWFHEADVGEDARARWTVASEALAASPDGANVGLSLRWFDEAKRARGIDAFLRFWFALETLTMPDTTNVRPLREALAAVYGIPADDVEARFGVGRLFALRSRIVHDGLRTDVPGLLLGVVAGIYVDLVAQRLGFEPPRRAQFALDEAGGLTNVLPRVVGGDAD